MTSDDRSGVAAPWLAIAQREEAAGVTETGSNARILTYLETCKDLTAEELADDSTAWCAAFANWCMIQAGFAGTDTSWARDWFTWGSEDLHPTAGSVVVWKRSPGGIDDGLYGHVSFLIAAKTDEMIVLGGNQANKVCRLSYPREGFLRGDYYSDIAFRKPA